ncbi:MAG: hypothetical protein HFH67_15835 [Lachnospiraceae bacterium]|nr:hypothetical protein [Lachnospiraceae bacterium]
MARKINEDIYGISDRRYRELVYFCLQYKEWKEWLKHNESTVHGQAISTIPGKNTGYGNPVLELAVKREKIQDKCKVLETAAEEASPVFSKYILKHVTDGNITYRYLNLVLQMPCGKKKYYEMRRKFFQILDKKI